MRTGKNYVRKATPEARAVMGELIKRETSLRKWAKKHGFNYRTVHYALCGWAHRPNETPPGGKSAEIMKKLRAELKKKEKAAK